MSIPNDALPTNRVVWARVENYPWWPARVCEPSEGEVLYKNETKVLFFQDSSVCYVSSTSVKNWNGYDEFEWYEEQSEPIPIYDRVRMHNAAIYARNFSAKFTRR